MAQRAGIGVNPAHSKAQNGPRSCKVKVKNRFSQIACAGITTVIREKGINKVCVSLVVISKTGELIKRYLVVLNTSEAGF